MENREPHSLSLLHNLQISVLLLIVLYVGQALFIPMCFGLLIAMVMYPVCKWLEERGMKRSLAITLCLTLVAGLFLCLLLLLGWQFSLFREDIPELTARLSPMLPDVQKWLSEQLAVSVAVQNEWLHSMSENLSVNAGRFLGTAISNTANALFGLFLVPIHAALFLYHRGTFVRFIQQLLGRRLQQRFDLILQETIHTYFNYIKGMILVYLIVGILNSIGLLALGIEHAVLFGLLTAIMTIIPYVGIIVSAALPVSLAFITTGSIWYPIGVISVFSFVQYLEANVIFPKVVGTQLNVSTWITLVAIITGGIIWGVSGMVLFIPFVAILKIISGYVPGMKAWHTLLSRK